MQKVIEHCALGWGEAGGDVPIAEGERPTSHLFTVQVGEMWQKAGQDERAPYVAIAAADKDRYLGELEAHNYRWHAPHVLRMQRDMPDLQNGPFLNLSTDMLGEQDMGRCVGWRHRQHSSRRRQQHSRWRACLPDSCRRRRMCSFPAAAAATACSNFPALHRRSPPASRSSSSSSFPWVPRSYPPASSGSSWLCPGSMHLPLGSRLACHISSSSTCHSCSSRRHRISRCSCRARRHR